MIYTPLGQDTIVSFDTLKQLQKGRQKTNPFEFKKEYLPIIVSVLGVSSIFVIRNIIKKRKRKK